MDSSVPTAYLDTCLVSGLAKNDLKELEQTSLFSLLGMHKQGRIQVVTSKVTKQELNRHQGGLDQHEAIYNLLRDVPLASEGNPDGMLLMGVGGGADPLFSELKALLTDVDDARHVFQAIHNKVDYFVTADERTILAHAGTLDERYGLKARLPSQLRAELS